MEEKDHDSFNPAVPNDSSIFSKDARAQHEQEQQSAPPPPNSEQASYKHDAPDDEPFIPLDKLKKPKKPNENPVAPRVIKSIYKKKWYVIVAILLLVIGFFAYKYFATSNELQKANDFTNNSEELAKAIQEEVSKYVSDLPKEVPKLDTINDPTASGGSILFKDTQKGDKILYYESAGKALIYRPSTKQVVLYTYVAPQEPQTEQEQSTGESSGSEGLPESVTNPPTP